MIECLLCKEMLQSISDLCLGRKSVLSLTSVTSASLLCRVTIVNHTLS